MFSIYLSFCRGRDEDLKALIAAKAHLGTRNTNYQMRPYVWRRSTDGE